MEEKEIQEIIEKKQKYLRDEILSQNYDADEFSEFISQYKENGLDLSNWTFEELKDAVQKFKNKNKVEDDEKSIEKGVENIKNSYIINRVEDLIEKPDNNTNLENKNDNDNINNNNNCLDFDIIDYVDDKKTNEKNKLRIMNSSIRIAELDLENEGINNIVNIQKFSDNPNEGNQNISKDNKVEIIENNNKNIGETMELIQNNNNNNNIINENNNIIQYTNEKKSLCDDFEILDNPYINNNKNTGNNNLNNNVNNIYNNNGNSIYNNNPNNIYNNTGNNNLNNNVNNIYSNNPNNIYNNNPNNINQNINDMNQLKLKCVKQPENSLTNNNNLEVNLEM